MVTYKMVLPGYIYETGDGVYRDVCLNLLSLATVFQFVVILLTD